MDAELATPCAKGHAAAFTFANRDAFFGGVSQAYRLSMSLPTLPLEEYHREIAHLGDTEADRVQKMRIGQDRFRSALMIYWDATCQLTGINDVPLLRASHIVPWVDCDSDGERLGEVDYLLGVGDIARQGALRFKETADGTFLASGDGASVPPLIRLGELLNAAMRVAANSDDDGDLRHILAPGSSLGGARAKASVLDQQGELSIAKFPQADDAYPVMHWEAVALDLARRAGIAVPTWRLEQVADRTALLLCRFDRDGDIRIPFLSAMSMLGATDNEHHSYLEIVDALRQFGSQPERDCAQLWRRIVFNILISNTDDHLRNHGFLFDGAGGWRLSPAYDMNPTPLDVRARILSLAIDEADDTASLDVALGMARQCGLKLPAAKEIIGEVQTSVAQWLVCAATHGLGVRDAARMASAFEHDEPEGL